MDTKLTEVSLSFHVTVPPITYVDKKFPYVVNTLGTETERVIKRNTTNNHHFTPSDKPWMNEPQPNTMRFVYAGPTAHWSGRTSADINSDQPSLSESAAPDLLRQEADQEGRAMPRSTLYSYSGQLQDVECVFSAEKASGHKPDSAALPSVRGSKKPSKMVSGVMTLYGIKYKNLKHFNDDHINSIMFMLQTESTGVLTTKYKATVKIAIDAHWDPDLLADLITNDPDMAQVIALCETKSTLGDKSLFSAAIILPGAHESSGSLQESASLKDGTSKPDSSQVLPYQRHVCRAALTYKDGTVVAMVSKLPTEKASLYVANILKHLLTLYEVNNPSDSTPRTSSPSKASPAGPNTTIDERSNYELLRGNCVSGIEALRKMFPELFVNNYTRECPVLPVMISVEDAERIRHEGQRVLFYYNRYYTAPTNKYFVGLKRNRLSNKDVFPCLVTCYRQDHMHRKGSQTYKYYEGLNDPSCRMKTTCGNEVFHTESSLANLSGLSPAGASAAIFSPKATCQDKISTTSCCADDIRSSLVLPDQRVVDFDVSLAKRPLPKCIQNSNYHRRAVSSFIHAVEYATGVMVNPPTWFSHIVRQEMWDKSDNEIMTEILHGSGSLVFRYYEELVGVSIHVVVIRDGNMESLVPRHVDKYVWSPPYPRHIVVFETYRTTYGKESCTYDVLAHNKTVACASKIFDQPKATIFDENDHVVSYLVHHKSEQSIPVPKHIFDEVREQVIDRNGKVSTLIMDTELALSGAKWISTYTRPIVAPVKPEPVCFLDSHIRKMNKTKNEMGLKPIDASKRSTNDVLYFPNDASFRYYVSRSKSLSTP